MKRRLIAILAGAIGFLCSRLVERYGPLYDPYMPYEREQLRVQRKLERFP